MVQAEKPPEPHQSCWFPRGMGGLGLPRLGAVVFDWVSLYKNDKISSILFILEKDYFMSDSTPAAREVDGKLRQAVERVLSERLQKAVKLSSMVFLTEEGRRSAVYRCTDETGGTYIVKQSPNIRRITWQTGKMPPGRSRDFLTIGSGVNF